MRDKPVDAGTLDQSELSYIDRLGLAYCRLNKFMWDPLLGAKPEGFDDLPNYSPGRIFKRGEASKYDIIWPYIQAIKSIIGNANASRCWWIFELGQPEEAWLQWYAAQHISGDER